MYDYLIVGAGLAGSILAYRAKQCGKSVLVIEKRPHVGGNLYCESVDGIWVHKYGPHIFHTCNKKVWDFINSLAVFKEIHYSPLASYKGQLYNLPFNMNTFYQLWGARTPNEAKEIISEQRREIVSFPRNLEEQAISLVGREIYEKLVKGYTEKQWGRECRLLPAFIIKRLPIRFTFDNNYFNDLYQGVPFEGYNQLFDSLLEGVEVRTETDFFENKDGFEALAEKVIYSGPIDEYFGFKYGHLKYRSLRFEEVKLDMDNFQGNVAINYTDSDTPYTRIVEHKHFLGGNQKCTVITKEYSQEWKPGLEPFYPINDTENTQVLSFYQKEIEKLTNVSFLGRLAEYKYYDMHQIVERALSFEI
mgnify:FL=1